MPIHGHTPKQAKKIKAKAAATRKKNQMKVTKKK